MRDAARAAFDIELADVSFQYPPRVELGDLALTAPFDLAKRLRRKPREIAERLAQELASAPGVRRAEVAGGGYVNLFLDRGAFAAELVASLHEGRQAPRRPGHVIVEHTSINPNKAAHIGHIRNACLGDTFVRLLRHRGYDVGVQNYIDDTGVQVADVVVGFQHIDRQVPGRGREDRRPVRLLLLGPLRAGGRLLRGRPEEQGPAGRGPPRHRGGRQRHGPARRARGAPDRGLPPRLDGAARDPLRPAGARERHPAPALLGPRLRAPEGEGRHPPRRRRARAPAAGCCP